MKINLQRNSRNTNDKLHELNLKGTMQFDKCFAGVKDVEDKFQKEETVTDFSINSILKSTSFSKSRKLNNVSQTLLNPSYHTPGQYFSFSDDCDQNERLSELGNIDTVLGKDLTGINCKKMQNGDGVIQESFDSIKKGQGSFPKETINNFQFTLTSERDCDKFMGSHQTKYKSESCRTISVHKVRSTMDKAKKSLIKRARAYYSNIQNEIEVQFVRALLDILLYPPSASYQQWVVQILKENAKVRQIFQKEKAKLGIQRIPVFKQKRSDNCDLQISTNEIAAESESQF